MQAGLSLPWSQTPKTGFLVTRLIWYTDSSDPAHQCRSNANDLDLCPSRCGTALSPALLCATALLECGLESKTTKLVENLFRYFVTKLIKLLLAQIVILTCMHRAQHDSLMCPNHTQITWSLSRSRYRTSLFGLGMSYWGCWSVNKQRGRDFLVWSLYFNFQCIKAIRQIELWHDKINKMTVRPASAQSDQNLRCLHEESFGP